MEDKDRALSYAAVVLSSRTGKRGVQRRKRWLLFQQQRVRAAMIKMFFVRPGYFARSGGLWYEPGILLIVEPGEQVELFVDRQGLASTCAGRHDFGVLEEDAPPAGLMRAAPFMPNSAQPMAGAGVAA